MRLAMEHLLYKYGADIVLQGHVHSCALRQPSCSSLIMNPLPSDMRHSGGAP